MKWSEDQTIHFVSEYVKYECLYNVNSPDFRSKSIRNAALQKLSSSMNMPDFGPKDAYHKMRSIKSTYSQELKKIKNSANSDTGDIYTPNVKWFKILHDVLMPLNITGECKLETSFDTYPNSPRCVLQNNDNERKPRKRFLSTKLQNVANRPREQFENEFDIFGKSIAAQLKNMPLDIAIEAQMFVQSYLSDMRLRTLQRTSTPTDRRSTSSQSNYNISQTSQDLPHRTFPDIVLEYHAGPSPDIATEISFPESKSLTGE